MNQQGDRVVFNRRRGRRMAVAQPARSAFISHKSGPFLVGLALLGWWHETLRAQVIANPAAPQTQRPTVLSGPNRTPIVNIQTPNAAGVSRNSYSQFDVTAAGAVLNNSRTGAPTTLTGVIAANPWLVTGPARVIVNEVSSSGVSRLDGYVEIGGQRADLIIANPSGIAVNGGFINASGVTLTTGVPRYTAAGALTGFQVQGGEIEVRGQGLDARDADYAHILTRAARINAGIWAQALRVVAGANTISPDGASVTPGDSAMMGPRPPFAIDVAQLGGLYAGKIRLIGTEAGLGVVNAGSIAATSGELVLSANGHLGNTGALAAGEVALKAAQLQNSGVMQATQDLDIEASGEVSNAGTLYAGGNTTVRSGAAVTNTGVIAAHGNALVTSEAMASRPGSLLAAGLKPDGSLGSRGDLSITTVGELAAHGQSVAAGQLHLAGASVDVASSQTLATNIRLTAASGGVRTARAQLRSLSPTGTIEVTAEASPGQTLDNSAGTLSADQVTLKVSDIQNGGGTVAARQVVLAASNLDNSNGTIAAQAVEAKVTDTVANARGQLHGAGRLSLHAGRLENDKGLVSSGGDLAVDAVTLANREGTLHAGTDSVVVATHLDNSLGTITSGRDLRVEASTWAGASTGTGYGIVTAGRDLSVRTQGAQNIATAAFAANRDLLFTTTGTLTHSGQVQAQRDATLRAASITNSGSLTAGGTLLATATDPEGTVVNTGQMIGGSVEVRAPASIVNTGPRAFIGASEAAGTLALLSATIVNADDGTATDTAATTTILGLGRVTLAGGLDASGTAVRANEIVNRSALLQSAGDMQLAARAVTNTRSSLTMDSRFDQPVNSAELASLNIPLSGTTGQTNTHDPGSIGGLYIEPPHGGLYNSDYLYTTYTGAARQNALKTVSPMARMLAGGRMAIAAAGLQNYWSQVASGGDMDLTGVVIDQESWRGAPSPRIEVAYSGDYVYKTYQGWTWTHSFCDFGCDAPGDTRIFNRPLYASSLTANGTIQATGATIHNGAAVTGISAPGVPTVGVVPAVLPDNGLYRLSTDPNAHYLVETNPRFAGDAPKASSDLLVRAMGLDPEALQKRIGDGYYERSLVNQQISQLTGRTSTGDYSSSDDEYLALMNNALTVAKAFKLRPGVALSAEQMAQLTSDIVWLVSQDVTLADGTRSSALVPQVYLSRPTQARLKRDGALIAATDIHLTGLRALATGGTIEARQDLTLESQADLGILGGSLTAGRRMTLFAGQNIDIRSAALQAGSLALQAGGDLNLQTTASPQTWAQGSKTTLDRQARIAVSGDARIETGANFNQTGAQLMVGGDLGVQAAGNWNIGATQTHEAKSAVRHGGAGSSDFTRNTGSTVQVGGDTAVRVQGDLRIAGSKLQLGSDVNSRAALAAGGSVDFTALTDTSRMDSRWDTRGTVASRGNTRRDDEALQAAKLDAAGALALSAQKDVRLFGSEVNAQGAVLVNAGGSVRVEAAQERSASSYQEQALRSGLVSSRQAVESNSTDSIRQVGSSIGGATVRIGAGEDLTLQGSSVISDQGTTLSAGRDLRVLGATNRAQSSSDKRVTESGLMGNGGLSISLGRRAQSQAGQDQTSTVTASTVGAVQGDVNIQAAQRYTQVGSDVVAPGGDVAIGARQVEIVEARASESHSSQRQSSQSGVTVGLSVPALTALQSAGHTVRAMGQTSDARMQALGAAAAGLNFKSAVAEIQNAMSGGDKSAGVGVTISVGSSQAGSRSTYQSDTARGSAVTAGGQVRIQAHGEGRDGELLVRGSELNAGVGVRLSAAGEVQLQAAENRASRSEQSSSSSASVGFGFNLGGASSGFSLSASTSRGRENGSGSDLRYTPTHVQAGQAVDIVSGADMTLKGAVVSASRVTGSAGGGLTIESVQDRSNYQDRGSSSGFSVSVPIGAGTGGASVGGGKVHVDSNYLGVVEQSAIRAGDGGFQLKAGGETVLVGGAVTSTQAAIDKGLNRLDAPGVVTRDLQNTASYTAQNMQMTLGVGANLGSTSAGIGQAAGHASSVTQSAVSGLAGNRDARTGDARAAFRPIFDQDAVRQDVSAQATITAAFGQQAARAIGDYAQGRLEEARSLEARGLVLEREAGQALADGRIVDAAALQAQAAAHMQQGVLLRDAWGDAGSARMALHALSGALTAGVAGAAGAAAGAGVAPRVGQWADEAGLPTPLKQVLVQGASAIAGAAFGGAAGATASVDEAGNNYLYHYKGKIIARDRQDNDKIINLSQGDLRTLVAQSPTVLRDPPVLVPDSAAQSMTSSVIQDLRNPGDRAAVAKESDMGYVNIDGQARVFVQTGMDNSRTDAATSAEALGKLLGVDTGYINNGTQGIAGDVGEYLPNSLSKKDVLNEYTYRTLNAQGPTLILTHSAGNEDARKALQAGALYGHSYPNLSFLSLGSPVSGSVMEKSVTDANATYLGQVNDWRDPVTHSKTAGAVVVGSFLGGVAYGAVSGCPAGPLGCIFGAAVGAAPGVASGAMGLLALGNYHPFQQYISKPQSQSIMFDWVKNNPKPSGCYGLCP